MRSRSRSRAGRLRWALNRLAFCVFSLRNQILAYGKCVSTPQVAFRVEHLEWSRRSSKRSSNESDSTPSSAAVSATLDDATLSALTAQTITWCPVAAGTATLQNMLPFFAFTASLNAIAATDHLPSLHVRSSASSLVWRFISEVVLSHGNHCSWSHVMRFSSFLRPARE